MTKGAADKASSGAFKGAYLSMIGLSMIGHRMIGPHVTCQP